MGDDQIARLQSRRERAGDAETQKTARAASDRRLKIGRETIRPPRSDDHGHVRRYGDTRLGCESGDDNERH